MSNVIFQEVTGISRDKSLYTGLSWKFSSLEDSFMLPKYAAKPDFAHKTSIFVKIVHSPYLFQSFYLNKKSSS